MVDRVEVVANATGLRLDSAFGGRRADPLDLGFDPFLEPIDDVVLAGFAFKRKDLDLEDARAAAFFVGFDLVFAFDPIRAATYTNYSS